MVKALTRPQSLAQALELGQTPWELVGVRGESPEEG